MKRLIVLSGVPGSGKSYFSHTLKEKNKEHVYIVSSDALRKEIAGDQRDLSHDKEVWEKYYNLAKEYSQFPDAIVVLDSTHAKKIYRFDLIKPFKELYDQIDLICFKLNKELVIKQNKEREFPLPEKALLRLINEYELPDEDEKALYDHIDIITNHDTDKIINRYL